MLLQNLSQENRKGVITPNTRGGTELALLEKKAILYNFFKFQN